MSDNSEKETSVKPEDGAEAPKSTLPDLIRMFGILVLSALRAAQTYFREAV